MTEINLNLSDIFNDLKKRGINKIQLKKGEDRLVHTSTTISGEKVKVFIKITIQEETPSDRTAAAA